MDQVTRTAPTSYHFVEQPLALPIWRMVIAAALVIAIGIVVFPFLPRYYLAYAGVMIRPTSQSGDTNYTPTTRESLDDNAVQTKMDMLASTLLQRTVVDENDMIHDEEVNGKRHSLARTLINLVRPPTGDDRAEAAARLIRLLDVKREKRSYLLQVGYESTYPIKSARWTNSLVAAFVADGVQRKEQLHASVLAGMQRQIDVLRGLYDTVEAKEHSFLLSSGLIHRSETESLQHQLTDVSTALATAHARTAEALNKYAILLNAQHSNMLDSVDDALASPLLRQLRERQIGLTTGAGTPMGNVASGGNETVVNNLKQAIAGELVRIVRAAQYASFLAQASEGALQAQLTMIDERLTKRQDAERILMLLSQDVTAARAALNDALIRFNTESARTYQPDVELVFQASPPIRPAFPNILVYVGGILMLAISAAALLALPKIIRMTSAGMTTRWLPWFATVSLPLVLATAWFASLEQTHVAIFAPEALLAAILCVVLLLALIAPHRGALTLVLCAAVLLISITFRQRIPGEIGLDFQNGYKFAIWMLMLLVYILHFKSTIRYYRDPVLFLFGCFCLCAVLSSLYSPVPRVSFANALGTVAYFGIALVVVEVLGIQTTLIALLAALTIYAVINLLSPIYAPDASYLLTDPSTGIYRFQGVSGQPNSLSRQSAIFLILILMAYQRGYVSKPLAIGLGILAFTLAAVTQGRGVMIALLAALALQMRARYLIPALLIGVIAIYAVWFTGQIDAILELVGRRGDADEAMSLAGRTDLWTFVGEQIAQHPLIGQGYNSFEAVASDYYWTTADKGIVLVTHNAYLDVLFGTGVLGGILFATPFAILLGRWLRRPNLGRDLMVWTMLIGGMTEVEITVAAILPPMVFFIALAIDTKETMHG